jgi:transposase
MDNAAFHKSEGTRRILAKANCELMFLPAYSPDLNPIEIVWANLKAKVKKSAKKFQNLKESINNAFQELSNVI